MADALEGTILHDRINGPGFWRNEFFLVVSVHEELATLLPLAVETRGDNHDGTEKPIAPSKDSEGPRVTAQIIASDAGHPTVMLPDGRKLTGWSGEPMSYHFA